MNAKFKDNFKGKKKNMKKFVNNYLSVDENFNYLFRSFDHYFNFAKKKGMYGGEFTDKGSSLRSGKA